MAELPPKARKYLERIGVAAARMDELIQRAAGEQHI